MNLGFLSPRSGFLSLESGIFSPESGLSPDYGFFAGRFEFSGFWGRETKTDPPESVSGGENLSPTAGVDQVNRFRIGFGWVFRWVRSPNMFGQPY